MGAADDHLAHVVAFAGGKGGVGKSLLAANVGIFLAQLGKRVILLDAALGGANLHNCLGEARPKKSLQRLLNGEVSSVRECLAETQIGNLSLLGLDFDDAAWQTPKPARRHRLLEEIRRLDCDFLVIDLAPATNWAGLDLFALADCGIVVTVPEPPAVEATYRFILSAFLRRVRRIDGIPQLLSRIRREGGASPGPLELHQRALTESPELAAAVRTEMAALRPHVVVNITRSRADLDLGTQLQSAARRVLGLPVDYFGYAESDDAVLLAVRKRRPVVVEHPESKFAKNTERIARRILADQADRNPSAWIPPLPAEQTHYEVLEAEPGASEEELRRAHRRLKETFDDDALAVCGLCPPERLEQIRAPLQEAYDVLLDPVRRHRYDVERFPEGQPRRKAPPQARTGEFEQRSISQVTMVPSAPPGTPLPVLPPPERPDKPAAPPPPELEIAPDAEFTGPLLRRVREARGVELDDIAQRTKISAAHLRAIEAEQYDKLPAPVYVRGFVVELAKVLKLDPARVATSYLRRLPPRDDR